METLEIKTKEFSEDNEIRFAYKEVYLRLRRLIEKQKPELIRELDEIYQETAKKLNLL